MHFTFMRLVGVACIGLGGYVLLCLVLPRLRPRSCREQASSLFVLGACFCVLLGLWALGVARPYTWIAAVVVWGIEFLMQCWGLGETGVERDSIYERREAGAAFVLLVGIGTAILRIFFE